MFFGFFGTSSGFGKIFTSRLCFFFVFLVPPQVLAVFFLKTLPKPEEVFKKTNFLRPPSRTPLEFCFFVFFGASLDFGKVFTRIHIKENPSKNERNPGMMDFSLISNEILKGIHIKENPFKHEKSRNEGILPNFQ